MADFPAAIRDEQSIRRTRYRSVSAVFRKQMQRIEDTTIADRKFDFS